MYLVRAVAHRQAYIARLQSGSNIVSDSHPFCSKSINLLIPKIWPYENLILKIQVQR